MMKKYFALILTLLMLFVFSACKPDDGETTTDPQNLSDYNITWSIIPDDEIVGAWQIQGGETSEYYLFTDVGTVRIVGGSAYFESEINYGIDNVGNHSIYTQIDHDMLYGQRTYVIDGNTLTITAPADESDDVTEYVLNKVTYSPLTMEVDENFTADEELIGFWFDSEGLYSFEFNEDGSGSMVFYNLEDDDIDVFVYDMVNDFTYTVDGDKVKLSMYDLDREIMVNEYEYSIDGDVLTIDGYEYTKTDKATFTLE